MKHGTHATIAGHGNVSTPRACGAATFAGLSGAMWHVGTGAPSSYVVTIADNKLRGRWPEEVASHR